MISYLLTEFCVDGEFMLQLQHCKVYHGLSPVLHHIHNSLITYITITITDPL